MIRAFDAFSLPLLRWFDPEDAHRLAIQGLRLLPPMRPRPNDPKLAVRAFGLNFPNPIGMASGFDKNAEVPDALLRLGFGFVEIGSVTPLPQGGNPRPRLFRLERDEAVINRLGFNNDGADIVLQRLASRAQLGGIVGVNVGANKDSLDRVADYVKLIETFAPVASYFTVNVSSPNTPGLRNLQQAAALDDLLAKVIDARERVRQNAGDSPVLLKIAPDLSLTELDDVVHIARSRRAVVVLATIMPSTWRERAICTTSSSSLRLRSGAIFSSTGESPAFWRTRSRASITFARRSSRAAACCRLRRPGVFGDDTLTVK